MQTARMAIKDSTAFQAPLVLQGSREMGDPKASAAMPGPLAFLATRDRVGSRVLREARVCRALVASTPNGGFVCQKKTCCQHLSAWHTCKTPPMPLLAKHRPCPCTEQSAYASLWM